MDNLKRLLPYLRSHYVIISFAGLCMLASAALNGAFLLVANKVLQPVLEATGLNSALRVQRLDTYTLAILMVCSVKAFTDFGQEYFTQRTGQRVLTKLRGDLFEQFQRLSIGFFESRRTGEMMSRLTNDLTALQSLMNMAIAAAIGAPIQMVFYLGYMLYTNWRLSCFILVVLPPVALLISKGGRRIRAAALELQAQLGSLNDYLQEKLSSMRLIQTFGTRDHEIDLFGNVNEETYRRTMRPIRIQASLSPTIELTAMVGVVLTLWFGGGQVIHGTLGAAKLLTFIYAMNRFAQLTKSMATLNLVLRQADAAASRLYEIMDLVPDVRDVPMAKALDRENVSGGLVFEDVRFRYGDGPEVLHGISFEIKPGEVVALAGLSGSGKTTIAALVPRLYDPQGGRVLVDGHDLRDVQVQSLRALIGAVPQETTLFHGTIRDNIAYGRPNATQEEIVEAARRANADEFIRAQELGYLTPVGERGARLSGGQRQRLAIARALLRNPKILLLDEATSSLDAESESKVQEALANLMEGRTTLIIAHRFSTIQRANRILVLDKGRVVETGTHEELLARRGRYHSLYQMQAFAARREEGQEGDVDIDGQGDPLNDPRLADASSW